MATIAIELLVVIIIMLVIGLWWLWLTTTKKISQWRYKDEKDRGKIGEEHRKELIRAGHPDPTARITKEIGDTGRQGELEGRSNVQATSPSDAGKNGSGSGKKYHRYGIFKRFRR